MDELERGRTAYGTGAWRDAHEVLTRADAVSPLSAADLELLARAAYMLGRDDEYRACLERAYEGHVAAGDEPSAAECAWWIGHNHLFRAEPAAANGWFARGERLLERVPDDCAQRGYLLFPAIIGHLMAGEHAAAGALAGEAAALGERCDDRDLVALGRMEQGHALVRMGRPKEGLRLVDETMLAVTAGDLSPIVSGIVYCNTIAFCRDSFEHHRAREWTQALTAWCAGQPEMLAHQGLCLVHRAEIMTLAGDWDDALAEARRVAERFTAGALNRRAVGHAAYRRAEIMRLRGDFGGAETAYGEAARLGREPQPGLALLRLAQGDADASAAGIRRAVIETIPPLRRAAFLPAYVTIMVRARDHDAAAAASRELDALAHRQGSDLLAALAAQARGEVHLGAERPEDALPDLRDALRCWEELFAPYEVACTRGLIARACGMLGDDDAAALESAAAQDGLVRLGAVEPAPRAIAVHDLSARELEVLRLLAAGHSNREIAAALVISEHTVSRHLQNIYAKLRVSSRTAAARFAYEHGLT